MIWVFVHQQLRNDQRIHSPASSHPPSRLGRNGESFIKRQELTMKAMKTSETYKNCLKIWKRTTNWIQLDHISSCRRFSDAPELRSAGTCVISPGVRPSWHGFGYWNRECFTSRCVAWSSMVSWCWSSWWLWLQGCQRVQRVYGLITRSEDLDCFISLQYDTQEDLATFPY